jgi:HD-like signal output (HDOD) protein
MTTAYQPWGEAEILDALGQIDSLPTLPAVVGELGRRLADEETSAAEVARILACDQALTARVLRLANSAFYAPREPVRSAQQAVIMLGLSTVRAITLKASVLAAFPVSEARPFWLHALGCACAARAVARLAGLAPADDAFVMGLLHDIGKLALAEHLPEAYARVRARVARDGGLIRSAEVAELGCDHAQIGRFLCAHWSLPIEFRDAIGGHHDLASCTEVHRPWAACVHLADILARALLIGNGGDHTIPRLDPRALTILALGPDDFPACLKATEDEIGRAGIFFELVQG